MLKVRVLGCLFFLFIAEILSMGVKPTIFRQYSEYKILLNHRRDALAYEKNDGQLDLLKFSFDNMSTRIKLLQARIALTEDLISKQITEEPFTSERIRETFKLLSQTQKYMSSDLSELKKNLNDLNILNYSISKAVTDDIHKEESRKAFGEDINRVVNHTTKMNLPSSCAEATAINSFKDDLYILHLSYSKLQPFYAYCVHENRNTKAWTIIQRREDGSESFNRNWLDYKFGFGDPYGEFWIGLERLHVITTNQPHELWIYLRNYDNSQRYAKYSTFIVASERDGYRLKVDKYRGDANDSFGKHNNMKFSTYDKNNNIGETNCARSHKGGWWYNECYFCNLNGVYYTFSNKNTGNGINWNEWLGANSSLKYTHMAIRPI